MSVRIRTISARCSGVSFILVFLAVTEEREKLFDTGIDPHESADHVVDSVPVERRLVHSPIVAGENGFRKMPFRPRPARRRPPW